MKNALLLLVLVTTLYGCGSAKYAITSNEENLQALTKVTDKKEPCMYPYGGDTGKDLFFAVNEKKHYFNIYKKDNPFSGAMTQKTSGKNVNISPTYNSVTDKIAFSCKNEGNATSDIYMMSGSGGKTLRQITESSDAHEGNPSFSPDGKYLVYDKQSYTTFSRYTMFFGWINTTIVEKSEIWLKDMETGETVLLGNGYQPAFSPDGKTIAFVKYTSDTKSTGVWTMSLDGDNQVQITDAKKGTASHPKWSPDGRTIVFQSVKKDKKDADIYIVDVDGNNLTQITVNKSWDCQPYWTKDGYLYFVSDRGGKKGNYQLWRFRIGQ